MPKSSTYLLLLCFLGILNALSAQSFSPCFKQFTTADGLPSSEVYYILQDQADYIWFATDNGIARFDGYDFEVFGRDQGLEDEVVFKILEDAEGTIWVSTYSGRVYQFSDECFHPYKHNEILVDLKKRLHLLKLEDPDFSYGPLFKIRNKGLFYLDKAGNVHWVNNEQYHKIHLYNPAVFEEEASNNLIEVIYDAWHSENDLYPQPRQIVRYNQKQKKWEDVGFFEAESWVYRSISDVSSDELILIGRNEIYIYRSGQIVQEIPVNFGWAPYAFPARKGAYFICADEGNGLQYLSSQPNGEFTLRKLLPDHSISYGLYDRQGGLWISSRDAGVFYAPYPEISCYTENQGLSSTKAISIALTGDSVFYAGYSDGSVYHYNYVNGALFELTAGDNRQSSESFNLHYDEDAAVLYSNEYRFSSLSQANPNAVVLHKHINTQGTVLSGIRRIHALSRQNKSHLLINGQGYLGYYDGKTQRTQITYNGIKKKGEHLTFNAYYIDEKAQHWVGTLHGLMQYHPEQDLLVENNLGQPALNERVEKISQLPDGAFLFGTRGSGLIYHSRDTTYTIGIQEGLVSNKIRDVHISEDSCVWVATLSGISKIEFTAQGRIKEMRSFQAGHGLSSTEVYNIDSQDNNVWLVSSDGVVHFTEPEIESYSKPPNIRQLLVNGREREIAVGIQRLNSTENNVEVKFNTINYRMSGNINYCYRHQPGLWQFTKQGVINYSNLSSGSYKFEVKSQNQDGVWSESTILDFVILPPWYKHWLTFVAGIGLLLSLLIIMFYQRERRHRKEQAYERQIDQLERAALHAQMNPHFVFNSLTSIQSYILSNDKKSAVTYLAKFSRLIRDTLRVSVKGIHSLAEEVNILDNYFHLEKIRFGEGFEYQMKVADHLNPDEIMFPPLLIQPFIENAIKHGLKDRDIGGRVEVLFEGKPTELCVRIIDNGVGFDPRGATKGDSMGMDITKRRLQLMEPDSKGSPRMKVQLHYDPDGQITGTEIIIFIRAIIETTKQE